MKAFLNFPFKLGEDLIFGDRFCSAFFSEIFFPSTLCNQIFCPNFFNFILVGVIYPSFPTCAITLTVFSFHGIQSANVYKYQSYTTRYYQGIMLWPLTNQFL